MKAWISLVPLSGAALVAISRTMDYRHHWQDVLTGSFLGLIVAYFSYRQYYPPLNSDVSHIPYSPSHKRGGQVMTHNPKPSDTRGLTSDRFDDTSVRPRMPEQRYSDRPSLSDEETRGPSMA